MWEGERMRGVLLRNPLQHLQPGAKLSL